MTLARRTSDGVLWVGGVRCEQCGHDTYVSQKTKKCVAGHSSKYEPRGERVFTSPRGEPPRQGIYR